MDHTRTLRGAIAEVVREETRYLRHYWGQVVRNDDPVRRGRVKVTIPELGWNNDATAAWCFPRQMHALSVPKKDEYVEVYFMSGDPDRPVYLGLLSDFAGNIPPSYTNPTTHIVFEDPDEKTLVRWDGSKLDMGKSSYQNAARQEDQVRSTSVEDSSFWTWLIGFVTLFTAWVPVPGDGGLVLNTAVKAYITANPTPTSLTGKIIEGSDQVRIGDG